MGLHSRAVCNRQFFRERVFFSLSQERRDDVLYEGFCEFRGACVCKSRRPVLFVVRTDAR